MKGNIKLATDLAQSRLKNCLLNKSLFQSLGQFCRYLESVSPTVHCCVLWADEGMN